MSDPRHRGHFGCGSPTELLGEQVGIMSAVPHDDVADPDGDRPPKDRAIVDKGMKLSVLATGIDSLGKFRNERRIPFSSCKIGRKFLRVHAGNAST